MLAIALKIFSSIKVNHFSSYRIFIEIFLGQLLFLTVFSLLFNHIAPITLIIILIISETVFFLVLFGGKRKNELSEIKTIIRRIKENQYTTADEIELSAGLKPLENEIRSMYSKVSEDIEYLKKLEKMRTEFLANVSHELRTPIFAIQGFIETLLNGAINDSKVNVMFLEKANNHTLNLNSLLNDLIDISMIESGEMKMSFRFFNATEFFSSILNEFSEMAHNKNVELIFYPPNKNVKLFGDKNKLRQAVGNLIQNAIKYTENGKIEVSVIEEDKFGIVTVKDTGMGIPKEDLGRVFERFYRVDKARSRDVGGTGLGLAIVKHIVEAHGSKVTVISEWGNGSEFSFKLKR